MMLLTIALVFLQAAIQGNVVSALTGEPINDARLTLTLEPPQESRGATTSDGRFSITELKPGRYHLEFAANGFVRQEYAERVLIEPDQTKDIVIRMTPTGNVSGRIRDAERQPIAGVLVRLLRPAYSANGKRTLVVADSAHSNDRGEYRIHFVTPGRYYIQAGTTTPPSSDEAFRLRDSNAIRLAYTPVYYPGVAELNQAGIVDVSPGAEIDGIDLRMNRQQTYSIRGRLIDSVTGEPPKTLRPYLGLRTETGIETVRADSNQRGPDGAFHFSGLYPGSYLLSFTSEGAMISMPVTVGSKDIDGLLIVVTPGVAINGRVKFEGQAPSSPPLMAVQIDPANGLQGRYARVNRPAPDSATDRIFQTEGVAPGEYSIHLAGFGPGWYVKEATLDGVNVLRVPAQISASQAGVLLFVISPNTATVDGVVTNERFEAAADVLVALVPDRNRDESTLYRTATTDAGGRFKISGVIPGDYRVFAWETLEPFAYFDPEVLRQAESRSERVHLEEQSTQSVNVKIIPAP